jgi:hypothetical protein
VETGEGENHMKRGNVRWKRGEEIILVQEGNNI